MYLEHWGLKEFPYENVPDPRFFYLSHHHEEALSRLLYAVKMKKGGAMLSGDIGCGKTTLTKVCIQELSADRYDISLIVNPKLEPLEFLQEVVYQLGIPDVPDSKVKCLRVLNDRMAQNMRSEKETLLMVDEAQLLNGATLEEIRLLLNAQLNDRFLITIILFGQPELRERIKAVQQLDQRIPIKYHLAPFDLEDTARYVAFRLSRAGREKNAFTRPAIEEIYAVSKGVPRKINNLCDLALLIGYSKNQEMVDVDVVETIIRDGALL
jgi:general secretion pathway protein A